MGSIFFKKVSDATILIVWLMNEIFTALKDITTKANLFIT